MTDTNSQDINSDNTDDIPLAAMTVQNVKNASDAMEQKTNQQRSTSRSRGNERFRKKKINENIDRFMEVVPNDSKVKWSKNQVLEHTFDYITELQDKCQRYHTMDSESIQHEKIVELVAENDRLRKENECFLEIFRTLNIQPNGLLEMNHQLKNVARKEEKNASRGLLSPGMQPAINQMILSPPGQAASNSLGQRGISTLGQSLLSPTIINGNLVLPPQQVSQPGNLQDATGMSILDNGCLNGTPKKKPIKAELDHNPPEDMEKVFQELMGEADGVAPITKTDGSGSSSVLDGDMKSMDNPSSITMSSSSQLSVDVSTHQSSVTPNGGQLKLTSAATTPATMVTQSLSGPISTTASSVVITSAGYNLAPGQATTSVSSGMKVATSVSGGTVFNAQPSIVLQQPGQNLLLSLPGRPGLIPVKLAPTKNQPPVILPNQGQCGNIAKQLSVTPQKRRPIKIKEQGAMQQQIVGPSTSQTMTVRLGAPGQPGGGSMVLNSGGMMLQQTVQQPVVINTPGGGQQTVFMQVPVQIQQPVVQPQQQVVYIQQNGQLIPVVLNQTPPQPAASAATTQQPVSNPVIVNNQVQQQPQQQPQQPQQNQSSTLPGSEQPATTTSVCSTPPLNQMNAAPPQTNSQGNQQTFVAAGQNQNVPSTHAIVRQNTSHNGPVASMAQGFSPSDNQERDHVQQIQFSHSQKPLQSNQGLEQAQFNGMNVPGGDGVPDSEQNTDDILAQAAEHIFTQSHADSSQHQADSIESSSTQDESGSSHSSKHKKKKKKKEKEKKEKEKKEKEKREKEKKKKKLKEERERKRKKAAAAAATAATAANTAAQIEKVETAISKENSGVNGSGQEFLESLLQDSGEDRMGEALGSDPISAVNDDLGGMSVSQGDFLPGYSTISAQSANQPGTAVMSSNGTPLGGDGADILSNSMNFIGLPTLEDEEKIGDGHSTAGGISEEPHHQQHLQMGNEDDNDDNDDDDSGAHAFSPPCFPEASEEQSVQQSLGIEPPDMTTPSVMLPETTSSDEPSIEGADKGLPPPPYPVSVHKTNLDNQLMTDSVSRSLDILSQPWVTQTVTSSSHPAYGTVTSVSSQRQDTSSDSNTPASQYGNLAANFPSESRSLQQQISLNSLMPSDFSISKAPGSEPSAQPKSHRGTAGSQVTPPTFNFYSSTPSSSKLPAANLPENMGATMSTSSAASTRVLTSPVVSVPPASMSSSSFRSEKTGARLQQIPSSSEVFPPHSGVSQRPSGDHAPGRPRRPEVTPGSVLSESFGLSQISSTTTIPHGILSPTLLSRLQPGAAPSSIPPPQRHGAAPSVVPPPQGPGATLMRALEKPPKSFTKANIHRTLTSFDKEQEDKWRKEKEKLAKEAAAKKMPVDAKEEGKKPLNPADLPDDHVGHRPLEKGLVNKFPWLADEDDATGKTNNAGKPSSRNLTSFSVQSIAQSSAANKSVTQRSESRKPRGKEKVGLGTPKESSMSRKKTVPPPVTDGSPWNLWNPSFSKGNLKPSAASPGDEVTIVKEINRQAPPRTLKNILLKEQTSALSSDSGPPKGKRKTTNLAQQSQGKAVGHAADGRAPGQPLVVQSSLEGNLGTISSSLPPYSMKQSQSSNPMNVPFSQCNSGILLSEPHSNTKQFMSSKASSLSPHQDPKMTAMGGASTLPTVTPAEQEPSGDIFQTSFDFLFGKGDQSELPGANSLGASLPQNESNAQPTTLSKQSSMPAMRSSTFDQMSAANPFGQQSPVHHQGPGGRQQSPMTQSMGRQQQQIPVNPALGRQLSHGTQRTSTASAARSVTTQQGFSGAKRVASQLPPQPVPAKRQQKDGDIFRGSPALSDSSHLGSPDTATGSYGSPMMPGESQAPSPQDRFRYQQNMQGYPSSQTNVSSNIGTSYPHGRANHHELQKKHNPSQAGEVKKPKGTPGQVRNASDDWSGQGTSQLASQGSRVNPRHAERGAQNLPGAGFASEMSSPTVPCSTYSQNDLPTTNPGNSGLLSSLSPTRHLRRNELPTYFPSITVRNPMLASPPYPGKPPSTREPEINFDSMFASTRPNTLPLNVPHNYPVFPDHHQPPSSHNPGLSKHGHVPGHMGNFNFSNIFSDAPSNVSGAQVHPSQGHSLNHGLHPTMHLGNPLQSPAEEAAAVALRGGVNQRHRNQQLGNPASIRLDHLFNPNAMGVGSMGVPPHPFVPGMPPF